MAATPVELVIAGTRYRVVSSASRDELHRLAALVDEKIGALVPPDKPVTPQAMLLAAMAFAHDAEQARAAAAASLARAKALLGSTLGRVDEALDEVDAALRGIDALDDSHGPDPLALSVESDAVESNP